MITVAYVGNFGNNMFQYCFARLLAEANHMNLATEFNHRAILDTTPHRRFEETVHTETVVIEDETYHDYRRDHGSRPMRLDPHRDYRVVGYFQDADLFNSNEALVKSFFKYEKRTLNREDTLVVMRLGDFIHDGSNSEIIHYDWYRQVMSSMPGRKICLVADGPRTSSPELQRQQQRYLDRIMTDECALLKAGVDSRRDLAMHYGFDNIVCSNSTFSWWGCFLNDNTNIVTFSDFGSYGIGEVRSHGHHVKNLWNIRNVSRPVKGGFLDITK